MSRIQATDAQLDALLNEDRPQPWRRSRKGNLYRRWLDMTLTVFQRQDQLYGYCISPRKGPPRYSAGGYGTEDQAMAAMWEAVNKAP